MNLDWDGTQMTPSRRSVKGRRRATSKSAMVMAQRRALRMAARSVASRHYGPPGPYPVGELKGMDTVVSWANVADTTNTNANTEVLNLIQTGTGSWNRIGRKVCLKSIRVMGYTECYIVTTGAGSDLYGNVLRLCLVWDKQPSGAAIPTFDDIFQYTTQAGTEATSFFSPPAFDTMDRFRVIKDWSINCFPESTPSAGNVAIYRHHVDEYVPLPNLDVNYSGQSTPMTIADINTGALYLIGRALTNDATSTNFAAYFNCRIRYVD